MPQLLNVSGLTKSFGKLLAVNNLSFHVDERELIGIVGANGAGKTTVFNLLMGDFRQDSGAITFEDQEISARKKYARVNMGISRTHQIPHPFYDMSVFDNIRIGGIPNTLKTVMHRSVHYEIAEEIAQKVGLEQDLMKLPGELSLAKTKKLELARAMATNPKLLLVDEIFAGISPIESEELSQLLLELHAKDVTIIMIDHNVRILMGLARRMIAIDFGEKIAEGKPAEIATNRRVIEAYLGVPISDTERKDHVTAEN